MGLISSAVNSAFESFGKALMTPGKWFMNIGYSVWNGAGDIAIEYAKKDPMSSENAWGIVTGNIFDTMMAVAAALAVLYFVLGWLNESIDIRTTFSLEAMFRFFVRYIIAAALIVNSLTLAEGITRCTTALVSTLSCDMEAESMDGAFDDLTLEMEEEETEGGTWIAYGLMILIGGIVGGFVIIVCAVELVVAVMQRLFRMLLCIPFAPVALAGFAGGREFSRSGEAWIRTYVGYALEAVVIILAISISFGIFKDTTAFSTASSAVDGTMGGIVGVIMQICEYCLPMICTCACVKGADSVVRRCMGL